MLVMLAYDTPEQRHQNFLRTEFERMGGARVQYSIYLFEGEPHECDRVIRYMKRVANGIPGDIRLIPMEKSTWESQIVISELLSPRARESNQLPCFVIIW
jgi:CRISPR-associated endonuclease Cas2